MSHRDFRAFAKSNKIESRKKVPYWELRGNILYIEGQRAIIINGNLGKINTDMLIRSICAACRALERKGVIVAVHLRNPNESKRFIPAAKRIRARIQQVK